MPSAKRVLVLLMLVLVISAAAQQPATTAAPASDEAAIKQTALDYIEGFYEGNPERMERALHPDLAKRIVHTNERGQSRLDQMSALTLIQMSRTSGGRIPKEAQQKDVTILDRYENAASVKIIAGAWIDYLHMAKWNGQWKIVNVLWELKPRK